MEQLNERSKICCHFFSYQTLWADRGGSKVSVVEIDLNIQRMGYIKIKSHSALLSDKLCLKSKSIGGQPSRAIHTWNISNGKPLHLQQEWLSNTNIIKGITLSSKTFIKQVLIVEIYFVIVKFTSIDVYFLWQIYCIIIFQFCMYFKNIFLYLI